MYVYLGYFGRCQRHTCNNWTASCTSLQRTGARFIFRTLFLFKGNIEDNKETVALTRGSKSQNGKWTLLPREWIHHNLTWLR